MSEERNRPVLAKGVLGQTEVLFQAVAHLGPAGAAIVVFPFLTQFVGASVPLLLLLCLAALSLTALSVASLAKHVPSAGGFFSYVNQGLGRGFGFFTAWSYFLYDPLIPTVSILVSAGILEQVFRENLGVFVPWWVSTIVMLAIVHIATYSGVKQSADLNLLLGIAESVILLALALTVIFHHGSRGQTLVPFHFPSLGLHNLCLGFAFALLMFCGFESAAPLAEETADPTRSIPRTMILSLMLVGLLWIVTGYAMVIGLGVDHADQTLAARQNPFFELARGLWGWGWVWIVFALVNSSLAASVAGQNAGSRVIFALARASLLPQRLGRIHPRYKTPSAAITVQTALNLTVSLVLGWKLGPITALGFIGVLISIGIIVIYVLANMAVIPLYWRQYRSEWSFGRHCVVPILGTGLLGLALFYTVWPVPPKPLSIAEAFVGIWLVVGALLAIFLRGSSRTALEKAALVMYHGQETVAEE